jgi:uncharacterized protein DUF4136
MSSKILLSIFLLALPAAASAADVRVDYDRHKDFTKYRTFAVEVGPVVSADGIRDEHNTLSENRLRQAVTREFTTRGLEPAESGSDLVIRVSSRDSMRTSILSSGWSYPWYGRRAFRRWGYWGYYGDPFYYGPVYTRRYLEGSLTVDVVERTTGALVYRAHVTDEVGKDLDKDVAKAMDKAFKKYPVKELSN